MGDIIKFRHNVRGICVEQRQDNGFINATAMAVAHGKDISDWLRTDDTWELVEALADDLGVKINPANKPNSIKTRVAACYPSLVTVKRGSPENDGGTWIHPDLAIDCASWCSKRFAIQVGRWVQQWLITGKNPVYTSNSQVDIDQQLEEWERKHDIRLRLKDYLRVQLMDAVVDWAKKNNVGAKPICIEVHDLMNERIQGARARDIKSLGGLPLGKLLRDHFSCDALLIYSSINQIAANSILDRDINPVDAVNDACDRFLGKTYQPKLFRLQENIYEQGRKLKSAKRKYDLQQGVQLSIFDIDNVG